MLNLYIFEHHNKESLVAVKVVSRPNATSIYDVIFDGAAVNFSIRKGIAAKLHEDIQWLIKVHCAGHRVELALKDVAKCVDIQKKA